MVTPTRRQIGGWRDISGTLITRKGGNAQPRLSQIGDSPLLAFKFEVGNEGWIAFHMPHDFLPDSPIYPHTHWLADGQDENPVVWEYQGMYAKGHNQQAFKPGALVEVITSERPQGQPFQHMISEAGPLGESVDLEPDGIIYTRLRRISNGGTENEDGIFLLSTDIHYQATEYGTLDKEPAFEPDEAAGDPGRRKSRRRWR